MTGGVREQVDSTEVKYMTTPAWLRKFRTMLRTTVAMGTNGRVNAIARW